MVYLKKISAAGRLFYPSLLWKLPSYFKTLYLTFDDGPVPEVSLQVLEILKEYDAKATFFCIGENIEKYPEIYKQILAEGHRTGNHTHSHLKGWETSVKEYLENVRLAEVEIAHQNIKFNGQNSFGNNPYLNNEQRLFRPPYGRIKPGQIKKLQKLGYKIVMWDVISGDFDVKISAEECFANVVKNCTAGSILVFHDSLKASEKTIAVLPRVLEYYKTRGYKFGVI